MRTIMRCYHYRTILALVSVMVLIWAPAKGQWPGSIAVNRSALYNSYTPEQLVQNVLITGCLSASNVTFNGVFNTNPTQRQLGYFNINPNSFFPSNFPIGEGLILSTGYVRAAEGPDWSPNNGQELTSAGDADLSLISGGGTSADAAVLEFDFKPAGNTLQFQYIFSSEEYLEYCCSPYNDAFGLFLSGPGITGPYSRGAVNIALIPSTNIPVAINTIHQFALFGYGYQPCAAQNEAYYVNNDDLLTFLSTQFDGMTVVMTATYTVVPCSTYHIKMAVGDIGPNGSDLDRTINTAVFLKAHSFNSQPDGDINVNVNVDLPDYSNIFEGCPVKHFTLQRDPANVSEPAAVQILYGGTATNGVDIQTPGGDPLPAVVTIPPENATITIDYIAVDDGPGDAGEELNIRILQSCPCDPNPVYITKTIKIWEQDLGLTLVANNIDCGGAANNGSITATATNGSGENEFSLNGTDWQASNLFTGLTAGTYNVYVRNIGSCASSPVSAPVTIGTSGSIVANAGQDVPICLGSSVELQGSGGSTYMWTPVDGLSDPEIPNPIASPVVTTTYSLVVEDATGQCTSLPDQVTVTVNTSPVVEILPVNTNVCVGNSSITLTASGGGTYLWNLVPVQTTESINVNPASSTSYTVIVTGANGCKADATANVVVHPLPTAVLSGGGTICSGNSATLNLSLTGTAPWNVTYSDGVSQYTIIANNYSYNFLVSPTTNTTYTLVSATDYFGCASTTVTGSATVTVSALPTPPTSASVDPASYCPGVVPTITLTATGGTGTSISWYSGSCQGTPVETVPIGNTLTIPAPGVTTTYFASNVNSCGISDCVSTTINIVVPPTAPTSIATGGKPTSFCENSPPSLPYTLTALGAGSGSTGFEWFKDDGCGGTPIPGATGYQYVLNAFSIGTVTYWVRTTNTNCDPSACATITINNVPLPVKYTVTGGGSYCMPGPFYVYLDGSETGVNYQLYRNSILVVGAIKAGTGEPIFFEVSIGGNYTVKATTIAPPGCTNDMYLNANIIAINLPIAYNVTGGGVYCAGGSGVLVGLSGSQNGYSYQLYVDGIPTGVPVNRTSSGAFNFGYQTTSGVYTVIATRSNAPFCTLAMNLIPQITVTVNSINAGTVGSDQAICTGGNPEAFSTITAASGSGVLTYQWQSNTIGCAGAFTNIGGATGSTFDPPAGLDQTTYYQLVVTSTLTGVSCSAPSNCITVTVDPLSVGGTVAGSATVCNGINSDVLTLGGQTGNVLRWEYSTDGGGSWTPIVNTTTSQIYTNLTLNTQYRAVVQSGTCASAYSDAAIITMAPALDPGITNTTTVSFCVGGTIIIGGTNPPNALASGGKGTLTYTWQESVGCTGTWTDIPASNSSSFTPDAPSQTTCYRRKVTDECGTEKFTDSKEFTIYQDPVSQTINPTPLTPICAGINVSATFSGGSGGIPGTIDIYEFSVNTGSTWSPYVPGGAISTTGLSGANIVQIRTRREPPAGVNGCGNGLYNIQSWTVNPLPTTSLIYHQ